MKLLVRWAALALSFWVATVLIPGINVQGGFTTYLWVALLFGLLNATLGSLLKLLTLPAVILTLGLFLVVVNASIKTQYTKNTLTYPTHTLTTSIISFSH